MKVVSLVARWEALWPCGDAAAVVQILVELLRFGSADVGGQKSPEEKLEERREKRSHDVKKRWRKEYCEHSE